MEKLEQILNELFTKKVSYQIPPNGREVIVKAMPWVALIGGALTLLGTWGILAALTNPLVNVAVGYGFSGNILFTSWLSLLLFIAEAVALFVAVKPLKQQQRLGWNIIYWLTLLSLAYTVINFFIYFDILTLIFSLAFLAIGLYILFQIRSHYLGVSATPKPKDKSHSSR